MIETLTRWAAARGYRVAWGPLEVVDRALADVRSRELSAALAAYADEALAGEDASALRARGLASVVAVVKPRPAHTVTFEGEEPVEAVLPPTYVRYRETYEEVRRELQDAGLPGARVETLRAPLKQVTSLLGLVEYGRNNVTYAPGMGSWIQLAAYATDARLPLPEGWTMREPALLHRCLTCKACLRLCPTGAIAQDRFLLHADRCLTFANENAGPWPDGIPAKAHHALLGCLLCQRRCPENPALPVVRTPIAFTREETAALRRDPEDRGGPAWGGVREKLALLGQPHAEEALGRNLRALVAAARQ